jgi:CxxC motif-containing protein
MRELTCIVCPVGCSLEVSEDAGGGDGLSVAGNRCPRGAAYALEEIRAPKRTVTATCRVDNEHVRRVPVKTSAPCPRDKIPALLQDIHKKKVKLPVTVGDIVISDWNGEGINVVATRTLA